MLKNDGRERSSKKSKRDNINNRKLKRIKCNKCKELIEYYEESVLKTGNVQYIECPMCDSEVILK